MNKPEMIVIHCAATPRGKDFKAADIDKWHKNRGFKRIGYHYVINLDGTIEQGRAESEVGAHALGYNDKSIGICYIGGMSADGKVPEDTRTEEQKKAMAYLVVDICERYQKQGTPILDVVGHRDLSVDLNGDGVITPNEWMKECPSFEVKDTFVSFLRPVVVTGKKK